MNVNKREEIKSFSFNCKHKEWVLVISVQVRLSDLTNDCQSIKNSRKQMKFFKPRKKNRPR